MKSLLEYIPIERVHLLDTTRREDILSTLIAAALPDASPDLHSQLYRDITSFSRKKEVDMGNGFFLVHTRTSEVADISIAVGLLPDLVRYRRGESAHTVLCIIVPDSMSRTYLSMMARLARFLSQPNTQEVFRKRDVEAVYDLIREFEAPQGA